MRLGYPAALLALTARATASATPKSSSPLVNHLASCPGYNAANVVVSPSGLTAELHLAGAGCGMYGDDIDVLLLEVTYETGTSVPRLYASL